MDGQFFDMSTVETNLSTGTSVKSIRDSGFGTFNEFALTRAFEYSNGGILLIELQYGISWGSAFLHVQNDGSSSATWVTKEYGNQTAEATVGEKFLVRPAVMFGFN